MPPEAAPGPAYAQGAATPALLDLTIGQALAQTAARFAEREALVVPHQGVRWTWSELEDGVLWTDWEDTFLGPVEWDLASIIWNARILDDNNAHADGILDAYVEAGGEIDFDALHHSMIARAAVMSAWYPILYPDPSAERRAKLKARLECLAAGQPASISF